MMQRKEKGNDMAIILKARNTFDKEELRKLYETYMEQLNNGLIILQPGVEFVHESTEAHEIEIIREEETPAADPQRELHTIRMRLQHLLQSEFISSFDMKDIYTGEYVRDIRDADKIVRAKPGIILEMIPKPIEKPRGWFRWL